MKKISNFNLISLMIIILFTTVYGEGIYVIIKESGIDAYIGVLFSIIISIPFLLIFNFLFNYEPSLNIFEKNKKLFKYSFIPNLIFVLFSILISCIQFFNLTNFLVSQFLSETNPFIIGFIFSVLIIYLCSKDLSSLFKTSTIFLIINFNLFFISILGLFNEFSFKNLFPILENGIYFPFISAIKIFLINICPLFLVLFVPKDKIINYNKNNTFISYFVYIILSLLMLIFTIGVLGGDLVKLYQYPEYIVLRRINFLNFLTRIENILFIQWIFGLFILMSFSAFIVKEKLKFKYSNIIIGLLILILSLNCFKSLTIFNEFMYYTYPFISFIFVIYIIILFIKCKIKTS